MNEDERAREEDEIRHDIANAVAVLKINVEGMLDGVVEPTHERLEALREALTGITSTLERWRRSRM
jgi:hypothetical protein